MAMNEGDDRGSDRRSWTRRYPPLALIAAALLIVLAVLPSALTLPNTNPSEVPEYAPVPPQKENPPISKSNVSKLNLGSSGGITTEVAPPKLPQGLGGNPTIYNCVAGRQTEDPVSPPCSPFFTGDNGGATYEGVTKDEIRLIFYMDGSIGTTGQAFYDGQNEIAPQQGTYCDVDAKPNSQKKCANESGDDHMYIRITRAYERYLNSRYQSYGRHFHFWIYYSGATDAGKRRADAADNVAKIKPFAVIDNATFRGNNNPYTDAMARNGVMVFSSLAAQPRALYQKYDPLVWTFPPDIEQQVDTFTEFICKKVAAYPVSHSGAGIAHGQPRRYAFMYTTDPSFPGLQSFKDLAIPKLKKDCNVTPATTVTFPTSGYVVDTGGDPTYAQLNVARMRNARVTTIIWFGGVEGKTSQAADDAKFYPEIFYAGDSYMEGTYNGQLENQNVWSHAAIVTNVLRQGDVRFSTEYQAWREGDPNSDAPDSNWAPSFYRDFFMIGTAVQVAGPRLHPTTVAEGFHAIPTIASSSPYIPACFFTQGHFCVQDATSQWWDPTGTAPGATQPGCYRMPFGGKRFLNGQWPRGDDVFKNTKDPCNAYDPGAQLVIRTPGLEE